MIHIFACSLSFWFCFFDCAMQHADLSSPIRDQTHAPSVEAQILNYWTSTEVSSFFCFLFFLNRIY